LVECTKYALFDGPSSFKSHLLLRPILSLHYSTVQYRKNWSDLTGVRLIRTSAYLDRLNGNIEKKGDKERIT